MVYLLKAAPPAAARDKFLKIYIMDNGLRTNLMIKLWEI